MQMDKAEQNKFFRLLFDKTPSEKPGNVQIDVLDLVVILQCFGFALRKFEKSPDTLNVIDNGDNFINMEITCSISGMKATLVKSISNCKCPSTDVTAKAEFWDISGCGPSNQGNISRSMSSLVPSVTLGQANYINFLLMKVLGAINNPDVNQNNSTLDTLKTENLSGLSRHRSLDVIKTTDDNNSAQLPAWDAMPLVCSPKETSSPIPDLCNSLKQISLGSKIVTKLTDNLREMQKLISESLEITTKGQNSTFVKAESLDARRLSDIKISPLADEGENKTFGNFININKVKTPSTSGRKKTPQKRLIKKVCVSTGDAKLLVPPSKLPPLKIKRHLNATPTTSKNTSARVDTPRPDVSEKPNSSGLLKPKPLNLSGVKPKVNTRIDSKLASKLRPPHKFV